MKNLSITFDVEPADRSVGIMTEGFSAWDNSGTARCNAKDLNEFEWYDNETGNLTTRPANGRLIENALESFITVYYDQDNEAYENVGPKSE